MSSFDCIRQIDSIVKAAGWPRIDSPNSTEFQLINRWRQLLNDLAGAAQVTLSLSLRRAIGHLGRLAGDTLWQPEADPSGRVQVLGVLEATGMEFDAIWISGMDAAQWPPRRSPSPFIPRAIQLEYGMPDATPEDALTYSREVLEQLRSSAENCVISWCRRRDDSEMTASPLLAGIHTVSPTSCEDPGRFSASLSGNNIITIDTDEAPPVTGDERVRGGAYTVQRQFVEPFSAFVLGRLGVRPVEIISSGLSAAMRGNMVHDTLHNLFAGRPDRNQIDAWSHEEQERRIGSAIDAALADYRHGLDEPSLQILRLERERLRLLMFRLISQEQQRDEFRVGDVEYKTELHHGAVRLGIRIDRIDTLPDGRQLVIDYKTGTPKHFKDRHDNLTDLQLVAYAAALNGSIGGLGLINIDSREITYRTAGDGWRSDESWHETLSRWRMQLDTVLAGFAAGDVRIDTTQMSSEARPLAILSRFEEQDRGN
jgi:probable DNA repair protein